MRRFILALLAGGTVTVLGAAAPSSAAPAAQSLPAEFVQRALRQQPGETLRLFPGRLPPGLTPPAVPSGARLVGSLTRGGSGSESEITFYYSAPGNLVALRQSLKQQLQSGSWKVFPQPAFGPTNQGGFQASQDGPPDFLSYYRLDRGQALLISLSQAAQGVELTYTISRQEGLRQQLEAQAKGGIFANLPTLTPPPGAEVRPQGGGSSGADVSQSVRILAPGLNAGGLLSAYAAQLRAAGWKTFNTARRANLAQMTFTVPKKGTDPLALGTLTIAGTAPGEYKGLLGLTTLR